MAEVAKLRAELEGKEADLVEVSFSSAMHPAPTKNPAPNPAPGI